MDCKSCTLILMNVHFTYYVHVHVYTCTCIFYVHVYTCTIVESPVVKSCGAIIDNALERKLTSSSPALKVLVPGEGGGGGGGEDGSGDIEKKLIILILTSIYGLKVDTERCTMKRKRRKRGGGGGLDTYLSALVTRYTSLNCCRLGR